MVTDIHAKIQLHLEEKLAELDAASVKKVIKDSIRNQLGWLVVWGNVFGALLGVTAFLVAISCS